MWASSGAGLWQVAKSTRERSFPLSILGTGDEVAVLLDSCVMEKRIERPLLSPSETGSSLAKFIRGLELAFPHPTTN